MDTASEKRKMIAGNLALTQVILAVPSLIVVIIIRIIIISALEIGNLLPTSIRNSPSHFVRHLKTHYFQSAYPNP